MSGKVRTLQLLVTGIHPGEMVVIERTPTRAALRGPSNGRILVANDYLALPAKGGPVSAGQEVQQTSSGRFGRASHLLKQQAPCTPTECFAILTDPGVRMQMTVQQMVFSAAQGLLEVRLPAV